MATKKTHWSDVSEAGTVFGMKTLLFVHRFLGNRCFRLFLYPVIFYYYIARKEARLASQEYLQRITPYLSTKSQMNLSSFQHFMMFGEVLLDKFLAWMGYFDKSNVFLENRSVFDGNTRGGIIIVSHLGNAEICGALMEFLPNIRITALVHTEHAEKFNSVIKKVASNSQIILMPVTDITPATAMLLSEKVEAGEYIIIAGDRTPVKGLQRTSRVSFLGGGANFPQGNVILASLLKCPVFLMFCLKRGECYHVYIEKFAENIKLSRKNRNVEIDLIVQNYAQRVQYYCLKFPLQWFNFFPFWKE